MNRDYSYQTAHSGVLVQPVQVVPEQLDYFTPVCAVCLQPGAVEPVSTGFLITYAHAGCPVGGSSRR